MRNLKGRSMLWRIIAGLFCIVMVVSSLDGQIVRGSLRGVVQDSSGARITGASIEVRIPESELLRRASSDDRGEFLLEDLPSGRYAITVSARDFTKAEPRS